MLEPSFFGCALQKSHSVVDFLGVKICCVACSVRVSEEDSQSVSCGHRILYRVHCMSIEMSVRARNLLTAGNHEDSVSAYSCFSSNVLYILEAQGLYRRQA